MYVNDARSPMWLETLWEGLSVLELVQLQSILSRAMNECATRQYHCENQQSMEDLRDDIHRVMLDVFGTLMYRSAEVSDSSEWIHGTYQLMGLAPRTQRLINGQKLQRGSYRQMAPWFTMAPSA